MKNWQTMTGQSGLDFSIQVGQYFRNGVTVFRITEQLGAFLQVENAVSLEVRRLRFSELVDGYASGKIVPCSKEEAARATVGDTFIEDDAPAFTLDAAFNAGDKASEYGRRVITYITKLRELGYQCLRPTQLLEVEVALIAREINDTHPPKISTLYSKALAIERSGGSLLAAIPRHKDRGGRGQSRIAPAAQLAIDVCIERLQTKPKATIKYTAIAHEVYRTLCEREGQDKAVHLMPSLGTISARVRKEFGAYEICVRNRGTAAANKLYRSTYPRDRAVAPLEVVEFDDKDTRVFGIDARTGLPCGRIFITSGVDQCTAMPLGFSISNKPRSTWSAINAFANSVLPKNKDAPEWREVKSDIPYMGKMGIALFDNALYNHSKALEESALEISNSIIAWAKPYTPTEKSVVEDFNGRMTSDFLVKLPGFGGAKATKDMLDAGLAAANMTVQDFCTRFYSWVYDVYANTARAGSSTPCQKWELGTLERMPRLPADIRRIRMATMLRHRLKLRPEGVLFVGLNYQNHQLQVLRRKIGHNAEVELRYHPERLDEIFVFSPIEQEWFSVPCTTPEYVKFLTLHQHKLIRKMVRCDGKRNPALPMMLEYRQKLALLVEESRWSPKLKDRKWSARVDSEGHLTAADSKQISSIVMTELEYQVEEIECVEMDDSEEGWEIPAL